MAASAGVVGRERDSRGTSDAMVQDMSLDLARLDISLARLALLVTEAVEYQCTDVGRLAHVVSIHTYAEALTIGPDAVYAMVRVDIAMTRLKAVHAVPDEARVVNPTDLPTVIEGRR